MIAELPNQPQWRREPIDQLDRRIFFASATTF
jgi:hypothetical protein